MTRQIIIEIPKAIDEEHFKDIEYILDDMNEQLGQIDENIVMIEKEI